MIDIKAAILCAACFFLVAAADGSEQRIMTMADAPTNELLGCTAHALKVYGNSGMPPYVGVKLTCETEIQSLENWALEFVMHTGLTPEEVEVLLSESVAGG